MFLVDTSTWTLLPMHLIVDGFMYAPRVVLADPGHMGLDVTGYSGDDTDAPDETDSSDVKINKEE